MEMPKTFEVVECALDGSGKRKTNLTLFDIQHILETTSITNLPSENFPEGREFIAIAPGLRDEMVNKLKKMIEGYNG